MVLASLQVEDKLERAWFFYKSFLLLNISVKVILEIFFLIFSNIIIWFNKKEVAWRFYTTAETLTTTKQVKIIDRKAFAKAALNKNFEAFVMHVTSFSLSKPTMSIHLAKNA